MRAKPNLAVAVAAILAALVTGCGGDGGARGGGTLVFGLGSDPVLLDPAFTADARSWRVTSQIFETLVGLEPGGTELKPELAKSWEVSPDAKTYTFRLQEGVVFHDGEPFNARAVCFNFDRWFNFKGPLQSGSASFSYQSVFGGYRMNESKDLPPPLYRSCKPRGEYTAVIKLTRPSASLLAALTIPPFAIASPRALVHFGADEGVVDKDRGFVPTGTFATKHPIGTGAFKFRSWAPGERVVLVRNERYWGEKAKLEGVVFRPVKDAAALLQALQNGELHGYDIVATEDVAIVERQKGVRVVDRPPFSVHFVGINQAKPPMDKLAVRQAVAYGLDRRRVVETLFGERGELATEFMVPSLPGYADDVKEYRYDPEKAKALLREAGLSLPVAVDFWYLPDWKRRFQAFAASLEKSGFRVKPHGAALGEYVGRLLEGKLGHIYLINWTGDFADADNFLGSLFQAYSPTYGFRNKRLFGLLDRAEVEGDPDKRSELYKQANQLIMELLPGVPWVYPKNALAFREDVQGYVPSPTLGGDSFSTVYFERK